MCQVIEDIRDESHAEGRAEGREEGREEGICALVSIIKDLGLDEETAVQKLAQKLGLSRAVAQEKVTQYWALTT